MRHKPGVTRRGFDGAVTQATRLGEPAEEKAGAAQRVVLPAPKARDSPRREILDELLALPHSVHRLARLA
jgi:hypothetical protein